MVQSLLTRCLVQSLLTRCFCLDNLVCYTMYYFYCTTSSVPPNLVHISRAQKQRYLLEVLYADIILEKIGLDKSVHVSISSISDPQMSSSASESTSFCASLRAPLSVEACLLRIVFSCKGLVQVALQCATCTVVVYFAYLA